MRTSLWKFVLILFLGTFAISAASGVVTGLIIKSGIDKTEAKIKNGQVASCQRGNIQARKDNSSQYADWIIDLLFVTAVEHPMTHQTAQQRKSSAAFSPALVAAVEAKAWVPPIKDCTATVKRHGSNYLLAQPISFNKALPPNSALARKPPPKTALALVLQTARSFK